MSTISLYAGSITQQPASLVPRRLNYPTAGHSATNMSSSSTIFLLLMVSTIARRTIDQHTNKYKFCEYLELRRETYLRDFCAFVFILSWLRVCTRRVHTRLRETQVRRNVWTLPLFSAVWLKVRNLVLINVYLYDGTAMIMCSSWLSKSWWKSR